MNDDEPVAPVPDEETEEEEVEEVEEIPKDYPEEVPLRRAA